MSILNVRIFKCLCGVWQLNSSALITAWQLKPGLYSSPQVTARGILGLI